MNAHRTTRALVAGVIAITLGLAGNDGRAQSASLVVKPLMRTSLTGDESREVIVATAVFAPGGSSGRHTHPGDEYVVVTEGELEVRVDGSPPRRVRVGEAYHNKRGVTHEVINAGQTPATVTVTLVFDRGMPLTQPAP